MNNNLQLLLALLIGILSVARTARLIGFDAYPPMVWLRSYWVAYVGEEGWGKLIFCPFCSAPYLALGMAVWAWLALPGDWTDTWSAAWWWAFVNGVWGLSYLASIVVVYDQPAESDD
jgi:hypothetical protein